MPDSNDGNFDGSQISTGAQYGSKFGPWGTIIGAGAGVVYGGAKYLLGSAQRKAANALHPIDPGYQLNNEVIDNARVLGDQYANYQLPGEQQAVNNIKGNTAAGFVRAQQGATSGADLLDAANKGAYVERQQLENLATQSAAGKTSILTQYLAAKAAAGAEYQNKNAADRERYAQQMQLKNQLNNNATANQFSAADSSGKLIASIFASKGGITPPGNNGDIKQGDSVFNAPTATDVNAIRTSSDPNDPNS